MPLFALGLNHKTAPVDVRERLAFSPDALPQALDALSRTAGVDEAVILSTCNRTELYVQGEAARSAPVMAWLSRFRTLDDARLRPYLYEHRDEAMVRHVLRVASGLDSMVLGEPQILGQIKDAYRQAHAAGVLGAHLQKLLQHSFSVAKQVRTNTAVGAGPVSVAFAAVRLSQQIFGSLDDQTALLVGAGETIELAARHLHEHGLERMVVANRSVERARDLATRFRGYAIGLDEISAHLAEADIVIASTAGAEPLITRAMAEQAVRRRKHAPIFMVDLAVPRDIEAAVGAMDDIYLYTVDDLAQVVQEGQNARREAAGAAGEIIDVQAARYMDWRRGLGAVDAIRAYREQARSHRDASSSSG